jgi:hypothetical protein
MTVRTGILLGGRRRGAQGGNVPRRIRPRKSPREVEQARIGRRAHGCGG